MDRGAVEYKKEVVVDGETYEIHVLPPTRSLKLLTKLAKIAGEPFAQMAGAGKNEDKMAELLPMVFGALAKRLDDDVVISIIHQLVATAQFDGKPIQFERHFQAKLGTLFVLLKAILEVQYSDFFQSLTDLMGSTEGAVTPAEV